MSRCEKQDLKNLTQFGVLLAILSGMGMVAQEKDKGSAAMILSKPLPRASFLLAKFVALSLSFLISLALAAVGCYYYTVILFGFLEATLFREINLLLALFLLVYVALTLLCSTLFTSQVAAGGLALALMIVLSLLPNVPALAGRTPNGLLEWIDRLIAGQPGDGWPAVGISLGFIIVCLVGAWQVFERQEL